MREVQSKKTGRRVRAKLGIKLKLLGILLPIVIGVIAVIVTLVYVDTKRIILNKSEDILITNTQSVTNQVTAWMKETITALDMERDSLQYFGLDAAEELEYIKHTAGRYDSFPAGIYIGTSKGELIHASFVPDSSFRVLEKPWYKEGVISEKFIFGSVYFDEDSQSYVVGASGMLKDGQGAVRGVAAADIYLDAISEIVSGIRLEETGGVFLVDTNTDTVIGHRDASVVGSPLESLADELYAYVQSAIKGGNSGLSTLTREDGQKIYVDMEQVPDSKWMTVSYVPQKEILAELTALTGNIIFVAIIGCLFLTVLMERFIHFIVKPVRKVSSAISTITDGDFTVEMKVHTSDEVGAMAEGLRHFIAGMRETIRQIRDVSNTLNGQAVSSSRISDDLSGAADMQADSMNEMNRTVQDLTQSITNVAESAVTLSELVAEATDKGQLADEQMKEAVSASDRGMTDMEAITRSMESISVKMNALETSAVKMDGAIDKINSIVDLIRDIAEETNLLSLNASIEAARAGDVGRGFAVVASQIGKLASTSKEAVDNIAQLTGEISGIVRQTVSETKESADVIRDSSAVVEETGKTFNQIYESVTKTNEAVTVMVEKVSEVNEIAQTVAGITEQQSAASEEILATTENMRENAENVSDHSKVMAKDAVGLKENAELLEEHMRKFTI